MLTLGLTGRIWICIEPQDGRKSFDGLQAVVRDHLARDPLSADLFVFRNRHGDRLKILAWDGSGLVLLWKRLEQGAFRWPPISDGVMRLSASQLAALIEGMDWSRLFAHDVARPLATS